MRNAKRSTLALGALHAGLLAALCSGTAPLPAAAGTMPEMGATEVTAFKNPRRGCPAQVNVYVESYATGWPDGDNIPHTVTYQLERIKTNGETVKSKPIVSRYVPRTLSNGQNATVLDTYSDAAPLVLTMTDYAHNRVRLVVLKPFHYVSEWGDFTLNCY